jgi:hypothetical protein
VPLVSALRWDTGVQVHAGQERAEVTASLTEGTAAHPVFREDNDGRQVAVRGVIRPAAGLVIGGSGSRGLFVSRTAADRALADGAPGAASDFTQTAWGADIEYSRGYYVLRAETVVSRWTMPAVRQPTIANPLRAAATFVEARYKVRPALYLAARADHLGFSRITGSSGTEPWDAPITRVEFGGGYRLARTVLVKLAYQLDWRPDAGRHTGHFPSAQLVYWF